MMGAFDYLDPILIPLSLLLTFGYHAFLWHSFNKNPSYTSIGIFSIRRKAWFLYVKKGNDDDAKKSNLFIQSLRSTQMATTFTASIAIAINLALTALSRDAYALRNLFNGPFLGIQDDRVSALKHGSASLLLLLSFLCSSLSIMYLIDASFLIHNQHDSGEISSISTVDHHQHARNMLERGFVLSLIGNRVLCLAFPVLLWMLGPLSVCLSSMALVCGLYKLDFVGNFTNNVEDEESVIN